MSCSKYLLSSSLLELFGENEEPQISASSSIIELLPSSLILEILLRLPVKSIFACKCVCKSLYKLISDPLFARTYARYSPITALVRSDHYDGDSFYFVEIGENGDVIHTPFDLVVPDLHETGFTLIRGSCNGLLCLEIDDEDIGYDDYANKHYGGPYSDLSIYVVNPLLGDYMVLPVVRDPGYDVVYGFGVSHPTNEYKVLRLVTTYASIMGRDAPEVYGEIFTIGDDQEWRYFKDSCIPYDLNPGGITLNGAFHWTVGDSHSNVIFAFDIEKEKGRCMELPPGLIIPTLHFDLAEWNGHLCLFHSNCGNMLPPAELYVHVWIMKQYGVVESWTKYIILRSSIPKDLQSDSLFPVTTLRNGDLLISHDTGRSLLSFDPKTNKCSTFEIVFTDWTISYLFGYVPNFLSLKDALKIGDKFVVDV